MHAGLRCGRRRVCSSTLAFQSGRYCQQPLIVWPGLVWSGGRYWRITILVDKNNQWALGEDQLGPSRCSTTTTPATDSRGQPIVSTRLTPTNVNRLILSMNYFSLDKWRRSGTKANLFSSQHSNRQVVVTLLESTGGDNKRAVAY